MIFIRSFIPCLLCVLLHQQAHAQVNPGTSFNKIPDSVSLQSKDTDGDGVNDDEDKCANEKGPVDNFGCPIIQNYGIIDYAYANCSIFFASGSSGLSPASRRLLDTIVKLLKKNTEMRVTLNGYTDAVGNKDMNIKLSENRAHAVRNYLLSAGIRKENIWCVAYGLQDPIEDNKTKAGRAKNRRVVVNFVNY